jgi:hypothetical protein
MRTWDAPDVEVREVSDAARAPAGGGGCVRGHMYIQTCAKSKSGEDRSRHVVVSIHKTYIHVYIDVRTAGRPEGAGDGEEFFFFPDAPDEEERVAEVFVAGTLPQLCCFYFVVDGSMYI